MASATLFGLFLLSALTFYLPSTTAQPVTDMYGNIVRNGGRFHILPYITNGGGVERAKTGTETIPLSVVQSPFETSKGIALTITSAARSEFIPEGTIVYINFEYIPLAAATALEWTVVEGLPEGTAVKVKGYPDTVSGSFSIHRVSGNRYKLMFCTPDGSLCGNVGIVSDDAGHRLLVITQKQPFVFVLEELPSPSAASE